MSDKQPDLERLPEIQFPDLPAAMQSFLANSAANGGQSLAIHAPYEDAIIAIAVVFSKIIDGQDAATKKEMWTRWLDVTKPLNDATIALGQRIFDPIIKALGGTK